MNPNIKKQNIIESHLNFMAGTSFDIKNPILKLRIACSSCFFGEPQYYHVDEKDKRPRKTIANNSPPLSDSDLKYLRETLEAVDPQEWRGMAPTKILESAIDEAIKFNPEATLQEASRLRNEEFIRTTPQVILVRAANSPNVKGTGLVRKWASQIISRADEPAVGLAYQLATYGDKAPIPNSLKKAWKDALEKFNDYQLGKYRMESRTVKTVDVANLVHPKSESVHKLVNNTLTNTDKTWEAIISSKGSNTESWREALGVMGHMALLRNLKNLNDHGIEPKEWIDKLTNTVKNGKQLPFRYYAAYNELLSCNKPQVLDAIENCLMLSLGNLPKFSGKTMSLCDNSGSAWGTMQSAAGTIPIARIGNLSGILAGMISDEGHVGIFGDKLSQFPIRRCSSVFDQMKKADELAGNIGQATENGIWIFWRDAIKNKEHWDNVFIFSDMQAGHGGLYGVDPRQYADYIWSNATKVPPTWGARRNSINIDVPKLINKYRAAVNKDVNVFLVQTAGYVDTICPEFYNKTYILGGWGPGLFNFAASMIQLGKGSKQ